MNSPKFEVGERVQLNVANLLKVDRVTILHIMDNDFNNKMGYNKFCYFVKFDSSIECKINGQTIHLNSLIFTEGYLEKLKKPLKIGEHEVIFATDHINVGCHRIEKETILKIAEKFK